VNTATINYCTGIISQLLTSSQQNLTVSCPQQWSQRASGYSVQQRGDVATAHRWGSSSSRRRELVGWVWSAPPHTIQVSGRLLPWRALAGASNGVARRPAALARRGAR